MSTSSAEERGLPVAARTKIQQDILDFMQGRLDVLDYTDEGVSRALDQLVRQGDLKVYSPIIGRTFEYRLTEQGRYGDFEPPSPVPVGPTDKPPLSPGGMIMLETPRNGEPVALSELNELIEKGYLTSDTLRELIK